MRASELSLAEQKEQLAAKSAELEITKAHAEAAVNHIMQGITMFDADERLILCNARFLELYRLSPDIVRPASGPTRAKPKSATHTFPVTSRMRLPGFTSRWTMPRLWACSRASAASAIRRAAVR